MVVLVGLAIGFGQVLQESVSEGVQVYDFPEVVALRVVVVPLRIVTLSPAFTVGRLLTFTITVAVFSQVLISDPVTV